jgi:hypothetical protein
MEVGTAMKKTLQILLVTILLPGAAFAGKKKDQNATNWLDAPTPDGSPTLRETSDWLAKTLKDYAGAPEANGGMGYDSPAYDSVSINNQCELSYTMIPQDQYRRRDWKHAWRITVPLGAVDAVNAGPYETPWRISWSVDLRTNPAAIQGGGNVRSEENIIFYSIEADPRDASKSVRPEDIAPRVKTAMQHAVDLCKAAYKPPTQEKEPF